MREVLSRPNTHSLSTSPSDTTSISSSKATPSALTGPASGQREVESYGVTVEQLVGAAGAQARHGTIVARGQIAEYAVSTC